MSLPEEKLKVTAWLWFLRGLWSQSQEIGVLSLALQLQYDTRPHPLSMLLFSRLTAEIFFHWDAGV